MKKLLGVCMLLAVCSGGLSRAWGAAATDTGERFLDAYFLIQDGDATEIKGDWVKADSKFKAALDILGQIKAHNPDWNPHIIEFRLKYCADHLAALKSKLPAAPPSPPPSEPARQPSAPSSAPTVASAPASIESLRIEQLTSELQQAQEKLGQLQQNRDALQAQLAGQLQKQAPTDREEAQKTLEQIRALQIVRDTLETKLKEAEQKAAQTENLRAELQQAQEKLRQLEADRDQLNAKLQENLSKAAPAQTTPQIEELLKKNAELTAQVAELKERLGGGTVSGSADQIQLRTELAQTRDELEQTKQQLQKANAELASAKEGLEKAQAENVQLKQSREEIMAKLNEADRQLRAAKSSSQKDNEIILQLRKENALLRAVADRKETVASRQRQGGLTARPAESRTQTVAPTKRTASDASMKESGTNKLVATITAPAPAAPDKQPTQAPPGPGQATTTPPVVATEAVGLGTDDLKTLLNEARAAVALKDYNAAALKYEEVLKGDATNVIALSSLGAIRYQQGQLDEAEVLLRKAALAAPNDSTSRSLLGVVFARKGKLDDAFNELTRAVALDPRNAEAHNYLGITLSQKGWAAAAEAEIRRAIEINPQYADAHFNLAVIYAKQKTPRLELARYHYQKALDLGAQPDPQLDALLKPAPEQKPAETQPEAPKPLPPPTP